MVFKLADGHGMSFWLLNLNFVERKGAWGFLQS